jgi:sec-independent protein translocase protein TatA
VWDLVAAPARERNAMPNIGVSELVVILLILMLVFGASRLPALGESLGKTIRSFKRGVGQDEKIEVTPTPKTTKRVESGDQNAASSITDAEILEEKKRPS